MMNKEIRLGVNANFDEIEAITGGRLLGGKNQFPPKKFFPPRTFRAITSNLHIFPGGKRVSCSCIKVLYMLATKI